MNKRTKSRKIQGVEGSNGFTTISVLWVIGILVLTMLVFLPSLNNDFTNWDDQKYVLENTLLQDVSFQGLTNIITTPVGANHHPLTMLSLALNYQISELTPFSYHLFNLVLHLINTLLVFVFIYNLTNKKLEVAIITSVFFGIHPMHVESVAWIAERKDVLYTCFFLLSLISYLKFLDIEKRTLYGWSLLFFALSIFSKPAAVVLPLILVLIDYYRNKNILEWNRIFNKIPFLALSVFMGLLTLKVQRDFGGTTDDMVYSISEKIMFSTSNIFVYLFKAVVPIGLSAFYPYPSIANGLSIFYQFAPVALLLVVGVLVYYFRKNKVVVWGSLFFIINIALVLQFITVGNSIVSERYTYVPYIGLFFLLGSGYYTLRQSENFGKSYFMNIINLLLVGAVVFYSIISYNQNKVWENSKTLWSNVIRFSPESYTAWYNRGLYYDSKGSYDKAIADYSEAITIKPNHVQSLNNRGRLYYRYKQNEMAIKDYSSAILYNPSMTKAYIGRGNSLIELHKFDSAIVDYSKAIELDSYSLQGYQGMGNAYFLKGDYELAIDHYAQVILLDPLHIDANYNCGICYANLGDKKKALEFILRAQELGKPISQELMQWLSQ